MSPRSLPPLSGREVIRALERAGFRLDRVRGSHHVLLKPGSPSRFVTVPVHGRKELPHGTLRSVVKQSGFSIEDFVDLL